MKIIYRILTRGICLGGSLLAFAPLQAQKPLEIAPSLEARQQIGGEEPTSQLPAPASLAGDGSEASSSPLSEQEKNAICRQYTNSFISYYSRVFHIKDCQRWELDSEQIYQLTRKGGALKEVDLKVIAALPQGGSYVIPSTHKQSPLCERYHHQYVTFAFVDIYWVEGCVKRRFPDLASYESHRGKLKNANTSLQSLSLEEFDGLKEGAPMPSVIDEEFRDLIKNDVVDVIPLDEACRGIIGQYVTYLGQLYFIEAMPRHKGAAGVKFCQKRKVDAEAFTRQHGHEKFRLAELNSSQALSIPDGKPVAPTSREKPGRP